MRNILKNVNVILLLPCLISAQIVIEIVPGSNDKNPSVVVSGSDRAKATTVDMQAFQLSEPTVSKALRNLGWVNIDNVILSHASAYGFRDLYVVLKPKLGKILRDNKKDVKFGKKTFRNYNFNTKVVKPELKEDVTETMTTKWHDLTEISVGQGIKHIMGFNRIVHESAYGQEDFSNRCLSISAETEDEILLRNKELVRTGLEVKETTLEVSIEYEVSLEGDIYFGYLCTYILKYCTKHRELDINEYFRYLDYPPVIKSTEVVTFTYFHDPIVNVGEVFSEEEEKKNVLKFHI